MNGSSTAVEHERTYVDASGRRLASSAHALGLSLTRPDGSVSPIAIGAVPLVVDDADIAARSAIAARLVGATAKAARWRAANDRARIDDALGPTERRLVALTAGRKTSLAVARVDFLGSPLRALEVNATIPAMQGYSDIAAEAWLRTFAPGRPELVAANGSNTDALLDALLELHERERAGIPDAIALLCRPGDAQSTELESIRRRFVQRGHDARIVHPGELHREGEWLYGAGMRFGLVYRHLFLSRLDDSPSAALEAALANTSRRGTLVLNPPAPHLEMKDTLALLSAAATNDAFSDALALDAAERAAIVASVPWTRRLSRDNQAEIAAQPDDFVLKRSWSYGGRDVFVGRAYDSAAFRESASRACPGATTWAGLVAAAAADRRGGGFIVQRAVAVTRSHQLLCTPDAVTAAQVTTDYAAYASLGAAPRWGGVARAAASDIVNIVRGGAVVPVIRASIARGAAAASPDAAAVLALAGP